MHKCIKKLLGSDLERCAFLYEHIKSMSILTNELFPVLCVREHTRDLRPERQNLFLPPLMNRSAYYHIRYITFIKCQMRPEY